MENGREGEHHRTGGKWAPAPSDEWRVHMSLHEQIDRSVPRSPVCSKTRAVPPIGIELTVPESHDLGQRVQQRLEEGEESSEPDDQRDRRQLHDALQNGSNVHNRNLVDGVAQDGGRILRREEPNHHGKAYKLGQPFGNKGPSNGGSAWVNRLIDQSRCHPEIRKVFQCHIARVWTGCVDFREIWVGGGVQEGQPKVTVGEGI